MKKIAVIKKILWFCLIKFKRYFKNFLWKKINANDPENLYTELYDVFKNTYKSEVHDKKWFKNSSYILFYN